MGDFTFSTVIIFVKEVKFIKFVELQLHVRHARPQKKTLHHFTVEHLNKFYMYTHSEWRPKSSKAQQEACLFQLGNSDFKLRRTTYVA